MKTQTQIRVIQSDTKPYVGDKFYHDGNKGTYVVAHLDPAGFLLVNIENGCTWCRGLMSYEQLCREIATTFVSQRFIPVAHCDIKVRI